MFRDVTWQPEITDHGGSVYTTEVGKGYKSGLLPRQGQLLSISKHAASLSSFEGGWMTGSFKMSPGNLKE